MKKIKIGFTLVEVSLFLAITAAIFVGVAVGTSNSIFQQRYNDSVQSFVEFLRTVYSQVTNVQSGGSGNTNKAIYGKLVVFSESGNDNVIKTYNVIGDITARDYSFCSGITDGNLKLLCNSRASVMDDGGNLVPYVEEYKPRWSAQIQTGKSYNAIPVGYEVFTGSLLITRSPETGTVSTYFSNLSTDTDVFDVVGRIVFNDFSPEEVDFCINPNGSSKSSLRRNIRLTANARNASGIEIIGDEVNLIYDGYWQNIGNRCV